jgi:hypothetical protein
MSYIPQSVQGPASSIDNELALFNGTSGRLVEGIGIAHAAGFLCNDGSGGYAWVAGASSWVGTAASCLDMSTYSIVNIGTCGICFSSGQHIYQSGTELYFCDSTGYYSLSTLACYGSSGIPNCYTGCALCCVSPCCACIGISLGCVFDCGSAVTSIDFGGQSYSTASFVCNVCIGSCDLCFVCCVDSSSFTVLTGLY